MRKDTHYVGQVEDVMAYLDGELPPDHAQVVAAHLQDCEECQGVVRDLRSVTAEMNAWQIETTDVAMSSDLASALEERFRTQSQSKRWWSSWLERSAGRRRLGRNLAYGSAAAVIIGVLFAALWEPRLMKGPPGDAHRLAVPGSTEADVAVRKAAPPAPTEDVPAQALSAPSTLGGDRDRLASPSELTLNQSMTAFVRPEPSAEVSAAMPRPPMIARTAQLTIVTTDFDAARTALDDILKRHQGYVGEMSTTDPDLGQRELNTRLRIPAPQLDAAITEFKKLGRVEHESQNGEEVSSQFVDLEARLANARNSEQRLTELLRNRTGKLDDVLQVEEKISETRGEIERMEAQRKALLTSVDFATVNITLKQERKAQLQMSPPSVGTRFRNAAVDGYTTLAEGVVGFVEFLLSVGPSLLLWGAVAFFPARWAWRRRHREIS